MARIGEASVGVAAGAAASGSGWQVQAARHRQISVMLARDVVAKLIAPDVDVRAAQDLQISPLANGGMEVSARLRITAEDLASQMLVRLDEALRLDGVMQQDTPWLAEQERNLADLAISVAENIQGCAGDAGELEAEVASAVSASNQGARGVARYLIERLGVGDAFDALATFAREQFVEQPAAPRMHA